MKKSIVALAALLALTFAVRAEDAAKKTDTYPLTTCVVSGESLTEHGGPVIFNYEGHEVRFCCKDCRKDFLKDPAKYLKMIDDAAAKKQGGGAAAATTDQKAQSGKQDDMGSMDMSGGKTGHSKGE